jgi:protein CpxP
MLSNIKKVVAIACVTIAVGAATLPSLALAQSTTPNRTEKMKPRDGVWQKLNLTEAQKTQMKAIRESAMARRQNVLTAEQRAQVEQMRQSGNRDGWGKKALNLTEAQKQQMRAIHEDSKKQMDNVLTAEQKAQLQAHREQRQSMRESRRSGGMR